MSISSGLEQYTLELINSFRIDPYGTSARFGFQFNYGHFTYGALGPWAPTDVLVASANANANNIIQTDNVGVGALFSELEARGFVLSPASGGMVKFNSFLPFSSGATAYTTITTAIVELATTSNFRIHSYDTAAGIGVSEGEFTTGGTTNRGVALTIVTTDHPNPFYVTGAAFSDVALVDGFYTPGEGTAGVSVSTGNKSTTTGAGGGYSIALDAGTHQVRLGSARVSIAIDYESAKLDLVNGSEIRTSKNIVIHEGVSQVTVIGTRNVEVIGSSASEKIFGNTGNNVLDGGGGNDTIMGGAGDDTLIGGSGSNHFDGGEGTDTVSYVGRSEGIALNLLLALAVVGADIDTFANVEVVRGGSGNDFLLGDNSANTLWGGSGDDNLWGFGGNDTLLGNAGSDILVGGDGDDYLYAGDGQDWMYGQDGADQFFNLDGTSGGFKVMVGGDGDDTFEISAAGFTYIYGGDGVTGGGNDIIRVAPTAGIVVLNDFEVGGANDRVHIWDYGLTDFSQLQYYMNFSSVINGTVLQTSGGAQIWFLNGTQPGQLTASDFILGFA